MGDMVNIPHLVLAGSVLSSIHELRNLQQNWCLSRYFEGYITPTTTEFIHSIGIKKKIQKGSGHFFPVFFVQ